MEFIGPFVCGIGVGSAIVLLGLKLAGIYNKPTLEKALDNVMEDLGVRKLILEIEALERTKHASEF